MTLARSCLTSPITSCYLQCCSHSNTVHCCYNNRRICCMGGRYDLSIVQVSFPNKMTFIRIDSRLKSEPKQLCNNLALCRSSQTINWRSFSSKTNRKYSKWFGQSPLANPLIMLIEQIQEIKFLSFVLHASWWNLTAEVQRELCAMCVICTVCAICFTCAMCHMCHVCHMCCMCHMFHMCYVSCVSYVLYVPYVS
jgi:hypothetical protein